MSSEYYSKYIKYKSKYINLKNNNQIINQIGSAKKEISQYSKDNIDKEKLRFEMEKLQLEKEKLAHDKEQFEKEKNKTNTNEITLKPKSTKKKKYSSSSSSSSSESDEQDMYYTMKTNKIKPMLPMVYNNSNNLLQYNSNPISNFLAINVGLDPNSYSLFVGKNNSNNNISNITNISNLPYGINNLPNNLLAAYSCDPEDYVGRVSRLTSEQILCFEIIIGYYKNTSGHKKVIEIPFIGVSLKFPNYLFYVKSYAYNAVRSTGIYELIVYRMPIISQKLLIQAINTPMWIQYYNSFFKHTNILNHSQQVNLIEFNEIIQLDILMSNLGSNIHNNKITINYDAIMVNIH
jgi:hypothetical protein